MRGLINHYKDPYQTTSFPQVVRRSPQVAIGETQDQIDRLTTRAQISEEFWLGGWVEVKRNLFLGGEVFEMVWRWEETEILRISVIW